VSWTGGSCVITTTLKPNKMGSILIDAGDIKKRILRTNKLIKRAKFK